MERRTYSDRGLREAIAKAKGIRPLARKLGIDHANIVRWRRVPYEYILRVEAVTGVDRAVLRPELYRRSRRQQPV